MTTDLQTLRSRAEVPTDRGGRWIKQLSSHLGRKAEVRAEGEDGDVTRVLLAGGSCAMSSDETVLRFAAEGRDADALRRVEDVVGRHLETFAAKEGLRVTRVAEGA